jgi:hypothetical protein
MSDNTAHCACGRALHYNDPAVQRLVERMIAHLGPEVRTSLGDRTWLVPRHYIALHGLAGADLPTLALVFGFRELQAPGAELDS